MCHPDALCRLLLAFFMAVTLGSQAACANKTQMQYRATEDLLAISSWRSQAETYIRALKSNYSRDSDQYKEAERRYIGAETKANAWLDRLRLDLANGVVSVSERVEDSFEAAIAKSEAFMNYMERLPHSRDSQTVSSQGLVDRRALREASLRLWQEYREGSAARRDAMRAELRQLRWKAFEDL
jgi:hypothetical protein